MSKGIRLNLIGIWLQHQHGDGFYQAVDAVRKKVSDAQFRVFLDVWKEITCDYKAGVRLPSLQVDDEGNLHMAWSFEDEPMQFLVSIQQHGFIDWYVFDHRTGWSDGSPDYTAHVSEVPLEMVRRFFPAIIVDKSEDLG